MTDKQIEDLIDEAAKNITNESKKDEKEKILATLLKQIFLAAKAVNININSSAKDSIKK